MAELGESGDPRELIRGNPEAIEENARVLRSRAGAISRAADDLETIELAGWQGKAADRFRDKFGREPQKWYRASDSMEVSASALEGYAETLRWAQGRAEDAIRQWNSAQVASSAAREQRQAQATGGNPSLPGKDPGEAGRAAAEATLRRARSQLASAGDEAASIVQDGKAMAPERRTWLAKVGDFLLGPGMTAEDYGKRGPVLISRADCRYLEINFQLCKSSI
ncbi:WXG100 family type VII secretion target [Amycolatopsis jejuensis]|uniref:WXG100 family type VII secretion target n=1 Tax=Amycolatopsis jejuensis TaxID=330084 RepID=UPI0012E0B782|nr:hypothetical protein [Amycolatopsis jejuensis]